MDQIISHSRYQIDQQLSYVSSANDTIVKVTFQINFN